ncbi:MAG: hypothetical protein QM783_04970 [Phycisphaerales bacterium]
MKNKHTRSWAARYSSCEYLYLDMVPGEQQGTGEVRLYLDHAPSHADRWTFQQVLDGAPGIDKLDADLSNMFGKEVPDELRAAIRADMARERLSEEEEKARDRIRRREESKNARGGA